MRTHQGGLQQCGVARQLLPRPLLLRRRLTIWICRTAAAAAADMIGFFGVPPRSSRGRIVVVLHDLCVATIKMLLLRQFLDRSIDRSHPSQSQNMSSPSPSRRSRLKIVTVRNAHPEGRRASGPCVNWEGKEQESMRACVQGFRLGKERARVGERVCVCRLQLSCGRVSREKKIGTNEEPRRRSSIISRFRSRAKHLGTKLSKVD
jgi:hypothetical protein